jgi:hypothetical protein
MSPIDHDPKELERRARNINPGGWAVETDRPITTCSAPVSRSASMTRSCTWLA